MAEGKERRFSIEAKAAKRARKLAKKQKQLQQAQADLDQKQQAIDAIKSDVEGQPVTKKRKKDKTVSVDGVQTDKNDAKSNGGLAHEDGQLDASKQQKKRRKKKNKPSNDQDVGEASTEQNGKVTGDASADPMARIGDMDLAKRSSSVQKSFYVEPPEVANMPLSEVQAWKTERAISVDGSNIRPLMTFSQSGLSDAMLHATKNFMSPSPIQAQCIPIALSGRDLVGIAATGSGKTLAFGLPCLRHIQGQGNLGRNPTALIISPTRELAQQIASVMEEAGRMCQISCICVYGGVSKQPQAQQLRKGVSIVVATPGRLEDLMNDGACKLNNVSYLVLDEADRMLDLGFEPHIRAIASKTRADRQTLMFSATWPSEVQKLAFDYLTSPVRIVIGSQDLSASHSVTQVVEVIEDGARPARLLELLQKYHKSRKNRVLLFVLYKKEASRVQAKLEQAGWKAAAVHGDISQVQRSKAVEQFKSGAMPLLIATDVAARGLDIPDVAAVINYSFPLTTEDYVHRIGRTGRAGKTGTAHTFFVGANDKQRSGELINVLKEAGQKVPDNLLAFGTTTKKKESKLYGAHFKDIDPSLKATKIVFDD